MILKAEKIGKQYADGRIGLKEQSFTLKQGDNLCIVGESGCGKTTLLNIITGMLRPSTGAVTMDGENIYTQWKQRQRTELRSHRIGYMCYGNTLLENLTVWQNLTAPLLLRGEKLDEAKLTQLLERLELAHLKQAYPEQLSAGEYRRVCLARTLALEPEVLVADEPTSNLDAGNAQKVREILEEVKKSEVSLIVVTHDAKMQFEPVLSLE